MSQQWTLKSKRNKNSLSWMSLANMFSCSLWDATGKPQQRGLQRNPQLMCSLVHRVELIICIKTLTELLNSSVLTCAFCRDWFSILDKTTNNQKAVSGLSGSGHLSTPPSLLDVETVDAMGTHCKHPSLPLLQVAICAKHAPTVG